MELGDIVSWVPTYSKNTSAQMPLWLGVIIEKDDNGMEGTT